MSDAGGRIDPLCRPWRMNDDGRMWAPLCAPKYFSGFDDDANLNPETHPLARHWRQLFQRRGKNGFRSRDSLSTTWETGIETGDGDSTTIPHGF